MRVLLGQAAAGDREAEARLIEENSGLIWSIARRYYGRGAEPDDLYQLACVGFIKAVRGFDPSLGNEFSTYAVPKIAGEIRRFLRDDGAVLLVHLLEVVRVRDKVVERRGREQHRERLVAARFVVRRNAIGKQRLVLFQLFLLFLNLLLGIYDLLLDILDLAERLILLLAELLILGRDFVELRLDLVILRLSIAQGVERLLRGLGLSERAHRIGEERRRARHGEHGLESGAPRDSSRFAACCTASIA